MHQKKRKKGIHRVQHYRAKRYRADFFRFSGAITLQPVYTKILEIVENVEIVNKN